MLPFGLESRLGSRLSCFVFCFLSCDFIGGDAVVSTVELGCCGVFEGLRAPAPYIAKVFLEEGFFDDYIDNSKFTINVQLLQSDCDAAQVSNRVLPLLLGQGNSTGRLYSATETTEPITAMIGCMCSSVSSTVSQISAPLRIPMVSPSSTSPSLSAKDSHPYFARVVPSDAKQGAGLAELARHLGALAPAEWTRVSLIYSRSTYCESIAEVVGSSDSLANITLTKEPFVNIEDTETTTEDDYNQMLTVAKRIAGYSPPPRIFIFPTNADTMIMLRVFYEVGLFNNESLILGSEGFATDLFFWIDWIVERRQAYLDGDDDVSPEEAAFYASIVGDFNWTVLSALLPGNLALTPSSTGQLGGSSKFTEAWRNITREKLTEAGMPSDVYTEPAWFEDPSSIYSFDWSAFIFDATVTIILAIGKLVDGGSSVADASGAALRDAILASNFEGLTGSITMDENGDRLGSYSIVNFRNGRVRKTIGEYDSGRNEVSFSESPIFTSGTTEVPRDQAPPCAPGSELDSKGRTCQACKPGWFAPGSGSSCVSCPAGSYAANAGSSACTVALQGTHVEESGATEAVACPAGSYSGVTGAVNCTDCNEGFYTAEDGQTECRWCALGSYTLGAASSVCFLCPDSETTSDVAAKASEACICAEGTYRPLSKGSCVACPIGMSCAQGSDMSNFYLGDGPYPVNLRGYMSLAANPVSVFECMSDDHCPGGKPGTCGVLRRGTSIACGECQDGAFNDGTHCKSCDGVVGSIIFLGLIFGVLILTLGLLYVVSGGTGLNQTNGAINCAVCGGLFCTGLQSMGVFDTLSISWNDPVKALVSMGEILSFDLNTLRSACIVGTDPEVHYAMRLSIFPAVLILVGLTTRASSLPVYFAQVINKGGMVFNICFISIVLSCSMPLNCYAHPENGLQSMRHAPSILCFEGGAHMGMLALGSVCFLLMPLPYMALCSFGTLYYPRLVNAASPLTMQAMRFMYAKYPPNRYFYFPIPQIRNLLVSIVPAILAEAPGQVIFLCTILSVFQFIQVALWPWRGALPNIIDAVVSMLLQLTLVLGGLMIEDSTDDPITNFANVSVVVGVGILMCFVIALPLQLILWRRSKKYGHFICHHKAAAAAQARLLKMILKLQGAGSVFIDSDDLRDLDTLFDTVKTEVHQLVVFLTRDTLRRPWCAGEVTTAFLASSASVLRVQCPDFIAPGPKELEDLSNYVDESGCKLKQYNIDWPSVKEAFERLNSSQTQCLLLESPPRERQDFDALAKAILRGKSSQHFGPAFRASQRQATAALRDRGPPQDLPHAVISAENYNAETAASECILQVKMKEVFVAGAGGDDLIEIISLSALDLHNDEQTLEEEAICSFVASAIGTIVLLSATTMERSNQLEVICQAVAARDRDPKNYFIIPVVLPGYSFPSPDYFSTVLPKLLPEEHQDVEIQIKGFFKIIACSLSTHASERALELEVSQILDRCITYKQMGSAGAMNSIMSRMQSMPDKVVNTVAAEPMTSKMRSV